jgi:hypothetical protein
MTTALLFIADTLLILFELLPIIGASGVVALLIILMIHILFDDVYHLGTSIRASLSLFLYIPG